MTQEKVLFIGNSLTYYNDVPSKVAAIYLAETQKELKVDMIAQGGLSLEQHLKKPFVVNSIKTDHYSAIILQDFGGWPLCSSQIPACSKTSHSLEYLISLSKGVKAKPIWYATYQTSENLQVMLSNQVNKMGKRLKVNVADTGYYLMKFNQLEDKNNPFAKDFHPNQKGSWVIAFTIARQLLGHDISTQINVGEVCEHNWQGKNLKAQKFASTQQSKSTLCYIPDIVFIKEVVSLVNTE